METLEKRTGTVPGIAFALCSGGDYYLSKSDTARALRCFEGWWAKDALSCCYSAAIFTWRTKNYPCIGLAEIAMNMDVSGKSTKRPLSNLYFYCSRYLFRSERRNSPPRDSVLNTVAPHRYHCAGYALPVYAGNHHARWYIPARFP